MKLSKQSLMNALILATNKTASLMFAGAQNALRDGTLEIEGYIRADHFADVSKMGWTKLDPDKMDTYPPKGMFIAWGLPDPDGYGAHVEFFCWRDDDGFSCHESAYPEVLYWQPRPKPPVEKERSENDSK